MWMASQLPIDVTVHDVPQNSKKISVTADFIEEIVELRFLKNGIPTGDQEALDEIQGDSDTILYPKLEITFNVLEIESNYGDKFFAYDLDFGFFYPILLYDYVVMDGANVYAKLWGSGFLGFGDANSVRTTVRERLSEITDKLSLDYLRATHDRDRMYGERQ